MQLGGSSPERLARAAEICDAEYRYDEVNLNCGCPSAKVVGKKDADKCFGHGPSASYMFAAQPEAACRRLSQNPLKLSHFITQGRST